MATNVQFVIVYLTNFTFYDKLVNTGTETNSKLLERQSMKYYLLGKSGLRVSELALGAMSFGTEWGWGIEINEARKMLDLYIDNAYVSTTVCDDISYTCQFVYKWSLRRATGLHTATFESTDWMGNVGVLKVAFTVS